MYQNITALHLVFLWGASVLGISVLVSLTFVCTGVLVKADSLYSSSWYRADYIDQADLELTIVLLSLLAEHWRFTGMHHHTWH